MFGGGVNVDGCDWSFGGLPFTVKKRTIRMKYNASGQGYSKKGKFDNVKSDIKMALSQ